MVETSPFFILVVTLNHVFIVLFHIFCFNYLAVALRFAVFILQHFPSNTIILLHE